MDINFINVKKILVIKLRHIGDVLLTVPVFRALRENFPDAYIAALVNSGTEDVLSGNPLIDEIIIFDRNIKKMNPLQKYTKELSFLKRIRIKRFDMVVDLTSGDRAALISFASGAQYRIARNPDRNGFFGKRYLYTHLAQKQGDQHVVSRNLDVVRQFGIDTENVQVDFFIPEEAKLFVKKIFHERKIQEKDRVVHVHPTSRLLFKCWEDEHMAEVIRWLINKGLKVIVTTSPEKQEMEKIKGILSLVGFHQSLIDLSGKTTIKQLAAIAEASDLFLGVDSAPMHIAAAVGTPVVAIFGNGERRWRPLGDGHTVISRNTYNKNKISKRQFIERNLMEIEPSEVIAIFEKLLTPHNMREKEA